MIYKVRFKAMYQNCVYDAYYSKIIGAMNIDEIYDVLKKLGFREIQELQILSYTTNGVEHQPYIEHDLMKHKLHSHLELKN